METRQWEKEMLSDEDLNFDVDVLIAVCRGPRFDTYHLKKIRYFPALFVLSVFFLFFLIT